MQQILGQLYRGLTHRLVQVAVVYAGVGAALHRAAWYLGWTWDLPRWLDEAALWALGLGFIPVMLLAAFPGPARARPRLVVSDEAPDQLQTGIRPAAAAPGRITAPAFEDQRAEVA